MKRIQTALGKTKDKDKTITKVEDIKEPAPAKSSIKLENKPHHHKHKSREVSFQTIPLEPAQPISFEPDKHLLKHIEEMDSIIEGTRNLHVSLQVQLTPAAQMEFKTELNKIKSAIHHPAEQENLKVAINKLRERILRECNLNYKGHTDELVLVAKKSEPIHEIALTVINPDAPAPKKSSFWNMFICCDGDKKTGEKNALLPLAPR